jgi:Bardet-Biedl syndrome 7 protein
LSNIPTALVVDKDSSQKLNKLKEEMDRLQNNVLKMRETYQQTLNNSKTLSQLKMFQINEKFELNRDDASYTLSIEAEVPIDNVLLQCDVPIDLLDSEKNSCVLSYSDCDENVKSFIY